MMRFESPWLLLLLALVPLAVWLGARRRARAAVSFSTLEPLRNMPRGLRARALVLLPLLRAGALACLIVALARPQSGEGEVRTEAEGVAMMLVLDRSLSMREAMDDGGRRARRIDVVKRVATEFVRGNDQGLPGRPADMLGLVTFARIPEVVCPLVRRHEVLVKLTQLVELPPEQSAENGTAIGDALALAAAKLRAAEDDLKKRDAEGFDEGFKIRSKAIVLLTDGAENRGDVSADEAATLCREWGIRIYAIGIGGEREGSSRPGLFQLAMGPEFDEALMRRLADQTGGAYWLATDGGALRRVYEKIDELEKTTITSREYTSYTELFPPLAMAGAALLALHALAGAAVLRRAPG